MPHANSDVPGALQPVSWNSLRRGQHGEDPGWAAGSGADLDWRHQQGKVARRQLVEIGHVFQAVPPGAVVSRQLPDVAPEALRTITGTVRVTIRMSVDAAGNVSTAAIESRGTSRYFSDLALRAARDWKFAGGNPGDYSVRFEFTTSGITATPISLRPA